MCSSPGDRSKVLGIFAHPDDETFFAGATLAAFATTGCEVRLVTLTAGEGAEHALDLSPDEAADIRLVKYASACDALGVAGWEIAEPGRWRDLRSGPTLADAPLADVVDAVAKVLAAHRPEVVITVAADGVTGHPDHIRIHEAVRQALEGFSATLLCASILATDVDHARKKLADLAPGTPITSKIKGIEATDNIMVLDHPESAAVSRRKALAVYHHGLVSDPLDVDYPELGDLHVLRAVTDLIGYGREVFQVTR